MKRIKRGLIAVLAAAILVATLGCFAGCGPTPSGTFYTLQEAYEGGMLTREELMSIAYYHNGGRQYNEEIMGEEYTPIPKEPAELSAVIVQAIKQTYWNDHFSESNPDKIALSDISTQYFGCYNGSIAVKLYYDGMPLSDVIYTKDVYGICFRYTSDVPVLLWKDSAKAPA